MPNFDPDNLAVSYGALDTAAQEIRKQSRDLDAALHRIKGHIAKVADQWEGEARREYNTSMVKWDNLTRDIAQALGQISTSVDNARIQYQAGDKKASANFII